MTMKKTTEIISILDSPCLHKQEISIESNKNVIQCFFGIGFLNSKNEVSLDLPVDILIPIAAIRDLIKIFKDIGKTFVVDILLADKNAMLQVGDSDQEKISLIKSTTELFQRKLTRIFNHLGINQNIKIIIGSSFYEQPEYREYSEKNYYHIKNETEYGIEQLLTMKWYKKNNYDFRLSWAVKGKKPTRRDEEDFDKLYQSCFNEMPLKSIFMKNGKKSLPHGIGTAVPYSYYSSEENDRLRFSTSFSSDFYEKNKKLIDSHVIHLIKLFKEQTDSSWDEDLKSIINELLGEE